MSPPRAAQPPLPETVRRLSDADGDRLFSSRRWDSPKTTCLTCNKEEKIKAGVKPEDATTYRWYALGRRDEASIVEYDCDCVGQYLLYRWMSWAGIGLNYQRTSWEDAHDMPDPPLEAALNYAMNCDYHVSVGNNLIFWSSDPGTGKTFLASVLAKKLLSEGADVQFTVFADLLDLYTDSWRRPEEREHFNSRVRAAEVLFIDDLGREHPGRIPVAEAALESVIRYRVKENLPTVLTTNLNAAELTNYGDKLASLFSERMILVEVGGSDKRKTITARVNAEHELHLSRPIVMV